MNQLVRFVDRANSSISASEIVALADKIGITVHSAGTETLFKSRYLNDFITAEGVLQGYEVANPPPIEVGKEVEQTVPALKLWWAGMKASGVVSVPLSFFTACYESGRSN
jgi:EAL domain-containing protein (putative c-di-GMP-specific phosphodiesterase class I)